MEIMPSSFRDSRRHARQKQKTRDGVPLRVGFVSLRWIEALRTLARGWRTRTRAGRSEHERLYIMGRPMRVIVVLLLLAACNRNDALDRALLRDAGANAVDCGRGERADVCVAEAFAAGKAFRVRYDDARLFKSAKARTPAGVVYFYSFDRRANRVKRFTCTKPQLDVHGEHRHLVCMACLDCTR
jgi:hypothetical protein